MDDTNLPNAMQEQELPATTSANTMTSQPTSLIQEKSVVAHAARVPMGLWLIALLAFVGVAGLGYMFYNQQATLNSYSNNLKAYQDNLRQWTDQVNTLQSSLQDMRTQVPTMTMPSLLGTPTILPTAVTGMGDDSDKAAMSSPASVVTTAPTSPAIFDDDDAMTTSLSEGKMSNQDEQAMLASYLREIEAGQHKTTQPDGIAMFQSRQNSSDAQLSFDIFKSTSVDDTFYIYVRKGPATAPVGWYGPFSSFPGS